MKDKYVQRQHRQHGHTVIRVRWIRSLLNQSRKYRLEPIKVGVWGRGGSWEKSAVTIQRRVQSQGEGRGSQEWEGEEQKQRRWNYFPFLLRTSGRVGFIFWKRALLQFQWLSLLKGKRKEPRPECWAEAPQVCLAEEDGDEQASSWEGMRLELLPQNGPNDAQWQPTPFTLAFTSRWSSVVLRPAWATHWAPDQPMLHLVTKQKPKTTKK